MVRTVPHADVTQAMKVHCVIGRSITASPIPANMAPAPAVMGDMCVLAQTAGQNQSVMVSTNCDDDDNNNNNNFILSPKIP